MTGAAQRPLTIAGLQVVVSALTASVVILLLVALGVKPPSSLSFALSETQTLWLGVLMAMVAGVAVLVVILRRLLVTRAVANRRRTGGGEDDLLADFSSLTIVQCAIVEGAALLGLTIYLVADLGIGLLVGLLGLLGLVLLFPTRSRLEEFRRLVTRPE